MKKRFVRQHGTGNRGAWLETITRPFGPSSSEVDGELFDLMMLSFGEPAALFGRVRKGFEDALRRPRIAALDDEWAVDNGWFFILGVLFLDSEAVTALSARLA